MATRPEVETSYAPETPEQQAVHDLIERVVAAPDWGLGSFSERKGQAILELTDAIDGKTHYYIAQNTPLAPGETSFFPFRVTESVSSDSADLHKVVSHPKLLEKTGVYGYVAGLGLERYKAQREQALSNPVVDVIALERSIRNRNEAKRGQVDWEGILREHGAEDHIQVASEIKGVGPLEPHLSWFYTPDTNEHKGHKRLPQRAARNGKAGMRFIGKLVEPYVEKVPPQVVDLWAAEQIIADNPPR